MIAPRHPEAREDTLTNILWFASSNVFRQLLGAVTAFLRPLLLSPEQFGLFSLLRTLPMYAQRLHFGARGGLRYLMPLYESRRQTHAVTDLKGTVLKAALAMNSLMAAVLIGVAAFTTDLAIELRVGLVLTAAFALIACFVDHYTAELKGEQRFKLVGLSNYVGAVALLVVSLPLMLWHGLYGALAGQGIATGVVLGWMIRRQIAGKRPGFDWTLLKTAVTLGLPTLLFDVTLLLIRTADRFLISYHVGFEALGYYALGTMIAGYLLDIPGATREVMEGKLFRELDNHSQADAFRLYAQQPMVSMSFTMPWIIGPLYLALPVVIGQFLPTYDPGIVAAQWLCLGTWFLAVSYPIRGVLAANRWQSAALVILGIALCLHVGLSWWWLSSGYGIEMVAISTSIAFLMVLSGTWSMGIFLLGERPVGLPRDILLMTGLPLMTLAVLWLVAQVRVTGSPWLDLLTQWLLLGAYLAATGLLAVWLKVIPASLIRKLARIRVDSKLR
jgi:O-antigen/teichoic acid export membrane protein